MGSKLSSKPSNTPGPGAYNNHNLIAMTKSKGTSVRIGGPQRPELISAQTQSSNPGPGNYAEAYQTFGKNVKGAANMGSKYKPLKNDTPGPG